MDFDFELLPAETLQAEVRRLEGRQQALDQSVGVPPDLLEALLVQAPTISDYDHRCWHCRADFSRTINYARDVDAHADGCAWATLRRLLDQHLGASPA